MKLKLEKFQELVRGNGHTYIFAGTLGRTESFCDDQAAKRGLRDDIGNLIDYDITEFSAALISGKMPSKLIRSYLEHTLHEVDGKQDFDPELEITRFVEDMGLENCARFCTVLLHHAIVGRLKKKVEDRSLRKQMMLAWILMTSRKRGWQLAGLLLIGAIPLCTVFSSDIAYFVRQII